MSTNLIGGCWSTVNNKTYDLACAEEHGGGLMRFHYVASAPDWAETERKKRQAWGLKTIQTVPTLGTPPVKPTR